VNNTELKNMISISKGKKVEDSFSEKSDSSIRFIQIDDLRNDNNLKYTFDKTGIEVKEKDLIIAWDGANAGTIGYGLKGVIGSTLARLIIIDNQIYYRYLGKFLQNKFRYLRSRCTGATIPHISKNVLENIKIPLPSFEEQKRIADVLDKADALRQKRKQSIQLLDDYLESVFFDMFGRIKFNIKKLEDVSFKITDGVHAKPNYLDNGIPFISVKDITHRNLSFEHCKFISDNAHKEYIRRCKPELNDILYTKVGATYGRASIVNTKRKFSIYVSVCLIKPNFELINPVYLKYLMNNDIVKRQADKRIKGIGVPDLHLIEIKNFMVPLPPISLQSQFARIVEQIEQTKSKMEESLKEIDNLFNSLMNKFFRK
jgi:type I restriction enzyme, S subunit